MKRLLTILTLAVAIIAGGSSVEAKTIAKKKTKARTSQTSKKTSSSAFSFKTILNAVEGVNPNSNYATFRNNVDAAMRKLGYENGDEGGLTSVPVENIDGTTDNIEVQRESYYRTKGTSEAYINLFFFPGNRQLFRIIFSGSSADANKFVSATKSALGSKFISYGSNMYQYGHWSFVVNIESDFNEGTVTCTWNEEE